VKISSKILIVAKGRAFGKFGEDRHNRKRKCPEALVSLSTVVLEAAF